MACVFNYWKTQLGGGLNKYAVNLVTGLKNRNVDVEVVYRQSDECAVSKLCSNKLIFSILCFCKLLKIKPEIVYVLGGWFCYLPSAVYAALTKSNLIGAFHTEPDSSPSSIEKIVVQFIINRCDVVTFGSSGLLKIMMEQGFQFRRTAITPAGIDIAKVQQEEVDEVLEQFGISSQSIVLSSLGMTALKHKADGLLLSIDALKNLVERYPELVLLITRDGSESNRLKNYVRDAGMTNKVIFTGNVQKTLPILASSHIYLHTPLGEGGIAQALLEAASVRLPIVATSVGGIPDLIKNDFNGILVEPDAIQIADAIERLLQDKNLRERLASNAFNDVVDNHSWDSEADKMLHLMRTLSQ